MNRIRTEAFIPFPPAQVWAVVADFGAYADWNPLNIRACGQARLGAKIPMTFVNPARPGSVVEQTVTITTCEPGWRLAWRGQIPLLFRGHHFFELSAKGNGSYLLHGEDLSGLLPMTFSAAQIARDFVPAYEAVNRALAERVALVATEHAGNGGSSEA